MKWRLPSRDIILALTYSILLIIPDSMWIDTTHGRMPYWALWIYNLVFYFSLSLLLCQVALWLKKLTRVLYVISHTILHVLTYGFSISNAFLYIFFTLRWDAYTFALVNETTGRESSEFLETYVLTSECVWLVAGYILIALVEYLAIRLTRQCHVSVPWYVSVPLGCLFLYNAVFFCQPDYSATYDTANDYNTIITRNMLWKLRLYAQQYDLEKDDLDICAQSQAATTIDSCSYTCPNMVVVIGESYIKRHSSLYGYNKPTNPSLEKFQKAGQLFVFNDVITPRHGTSEAFKLFLSMARIQDTIRWCDTPLFPALFKKAGYHVSFYSNQFVKESEKDREFVTGAGFFYHPGIEPYIIDERNHSFFEYDGEMVKAFVADHRQSEAHPYNLAIFHLLGQHVAYKDRCPESMARFSAKDYTDRKELTADQKREVSEYDNATLYNDHVVASIIGLYKNQEAIVIYFSDHGEECNDFRPHVGRSGDWDIIEKSLGIECLRCQHDIPFVIYASPLYQQKHPEIIEAIRGATERPFETDDLPHLLLHIAGIHTSWYDPQRDVISPSYDTTRRRVVSRVFTDYDEFCFGK